jgi:hypothetical protein
MTELERSLISLGRDLQYPPTPEIAPRVAEALHRDPTPPRRPRVRRRAVALAFALLLVLAAGALAASPGLRDAVGDLFGVSGATVERSPAPRARGKDRTPELGQRVTLAQALRAVAFRPLLPRRVGPPEALYLRRDAEGGELSLAYQPRRGLPRAGTTGLGLLITEFRGDLEPDYVAKITPAATTVDRIRVRGRPAIWIAGAPHDFFYRAPDDTLRETTLRLAANVLLLERGRLLIRIEGELELARAREIARSLR